MCDFHEPYFGASYPDACCIDGFLWDLDSCDEPGGGLTSGGEVHCPQCRHVPWLESLIEGIREDGWLAAHDGEPRQYKHRKLRHEAEGDEAKCRAAWLGGYDSGAAEKAADAHQLKHGPCAECGAATAEEAGTKCHCAGDKDSCHGTTLWPDV
jgi:hypothetical protein